MMMIMIIIGILFIVFGIWYTSKSGELAKSNSQYSENTYKIAGVVLVACGIFVLICGFYLGSMLNSSNNISSSSNSHSSNTYVCGYCGKQMNGGYYDYINGKYACSSCSKKYRDR